MGHRADESMPMNESSAGSSLQTELRRAIVLLIILIAGMTNLPFPFSGDQALFTLGAQALSRGAVLCYTEIGIHIAELIWFTILASVISVSMRSRFRIGWMSDVCALLTVLVYFAVCGTSHLTQLEGLVSLPLFLSLLMVIPSATDAPPSNRRLIAFGTLTASVALFKLLLIAIPAAFFVVSIFPDFWKRLTRSVLPALAGFALVIVPVIVYFGAHHQLPLVYQTFFVYPAKIAAGPGMSSVTVLRGSITWFIKAAALLLPFAALGAFRLLKKPDRFGIAIVVWIVVATLLVLIQRLWWEYHFLLVLFPLGILATYGLEDAIGWLESKSKAVRTFATTALLVLLLCPYGFRLARKAIHEKQYMNRQAFDEFESPPYASSLADARWLDSQYPGEIYVLGNPLIYYLSNRKQDIPLNGWTPERFLPGQWDELVQQLTASQPRYIFIDAANGGLLAGPGAVLKQLLSENFAVGHAAEDGTWYERR
jgi:hypothetical protein